jgi:hypothetical protein
MGDGSVNSKERNCSDLLKNLGNPLLLGGCYT